MEFAVYGSGKNQKFAESLMPSLIQQLGLENSSAAVCVMIDDSIAGSEGVTMNFSGMVKNSFMVAIKPQNLRGNKFTVGYKELALTLAHEMVHVKQMAKGQLKSAPRGAQLWMGKKYPAKTPYLDQPWEIEAFSRQELLMRRAIEL